MRAFSLTLFVVAVLATFFTALVPGQIAVLRQIDDTTQHVTAFAFLTVLARLAFPRLRTGVMITLLACFGGVIELVQTFALFHRQADFRDWFADISAITGACLTMAILRLRSFSASKAET